MSAFDSARERLPVVDGPREFGVLLAFVVGTNLLGAFPAFVVGSDTGWFVEPALYPPTIVFPVVWTVLFTLIGVAVYLVWREGTDRREVRLALAAFAAQFLLNLAWTPAFFGLQRPDLGLVVIVPLAALIALTIYAFDRVDRRAAALLVPYLAWVLFATYLTYAIWAIN